MTLIALYCFLKRMFWFFFLLGPKPWNLLKNLQKTFFFLNFNHYDIYILVLFIFFFLTKKLKKFSNVRQYQEDILGLFLHFPSCNFKASKCFTCLSELASSANAGGWFRFFYSVTKNPFLNSHHPLSVTLTSPVLGEPNEVIWRRWRESGRLAGN